MVVEKKLFFAWQLEKEKAYLEKKAQEGLFLKKVGFGRYYFEERAAMNMIYQFDFRPLSRKDETEYLSLFEGWEYIDRFGSWYYFRKEKTADDDSIFSNVESKRNMFGRLILFLIIIGVPLYYQVLVFFPNLVRDDGITTFYRYFRPFVYILVVLHTYAVLRLLVIYKKLKIDITE